jgi:hypothetical protein
MADQSGYQDSGDAPTTRAEREATAGAPRWVKVFGIIVLVIILLFVVAMFAGLHDPSRFSHG